MFAHCRRLAVNLQDPAVAQDEDLVAGLDDVESTPTRLLHGHDRVRSLPASWTDLEEPDPFRVLATGRTCFRVADLLAPGPPARRA